MSAYRRLKELKHHRGKGVSTMPLNHVGTFQLKTRGDVSKSLKRPTNSAKVIKKQNKKTNKKRTKNGSTEVLDTVWRYPASSFFKETHFYVNGQDIYI